MRLHGIALLSGAMGIGGACSILHPGQPESMLLSVFLNIVWMSTMYIWVSRK